MLVGGGRPKVATPRFGPEVAFGKIPHRQHEIGAAGGDAASRHGGVLRGDGFVCTIELDLPGK
jgi:hypothetical protein